MTKLQSKVDRLRELYKAIDAVEDDLSKDKQFIQNLFQPVFSDLFTEDVNSIEWVVSENLRHLFVKQGKWSEWAEGNVIFAFKIGSKRGKGKKFQIIHDRVKERILILEEKSSVITEFRYVEDNQPLNQKVKCFDDNCNPILTPELKEYLEKQSRAVRIGIMLFLNSCCKD